MQALRYLLIALGGCLLLAAGVLLLWLVMSFQSLLTEPLEMGMVRQILEYVDAEGAFISGSIQDENFQLRLSGAARGFGFLLLGLFSLTIFAGIIRALLAGAVEIIRAAAAMQSRSSDSDEAGQPRKGVRIHKVV